MTWRQRAACRGMTGVFFPERGDDADQTDARAICQTCPVVAECLDYALTMHVNEPGIYAGLSWRELRRLRGTQGRAGGGVPAGVDLDAVEVMRANGMEVREVADALGVTPRTIYRATARDRGAGVAS